MSEPTNGRDLPGRPPPSGEPPGYPGVSAAAPARDAAAAPTESAAVAPELGARRLRPRSGTADQPSGLTPGAALGAAAAAPLGGSGLQAESGPPLAAGDLTATPQVPAGAVPRRPQIGDSRPAPLPRIAPPGRSAMPAAQGPTGAPSGAALNGSARTSVDGVPGSA
ncbi:MAG TPA: hypothetical protein VMD59_21610, partial [Acidimicrobiales bacterium]|nr:hypothetical protein [Acidimicrobiales bacterium]